ncbi:uncharacterized protein METZ01_LOCUS304497, partial [marine metagenome]
VGGKAEAPTVHGFGLMSIPASLGRPSRWLLWARRIHIAPNLILQFGRVSLSTAFWSSVMGLSRKVSTVKLPNSE